jgi:hypothetical protein
MILYTAHPDTVFSPTVVVTLGAVAFSVSIIEFVLDLFGPRESIERDVS